RRGTAPARRRRHRRRLRCGRRAGRNPRQGARPAARSWREQRMNSFDPRNAPLLAWVDGVESDAIDIADRGLAYGDGLFETFRVVDERPLWWERHLARLMRGAQALGIEMPNPTRLHIEALNCCDGAVDGVLKLILTRGSTGRGYTPMRAGPGESRPTRILSLHPSPARQDGVSAIRCTTRLAVQPQLAGLKHLNRLEQVLAARECQDRKSGGWGKRVSRGRKRHANEA